jgi:hypothetical protein
MQSQLSARSSGRTPLPGLSVGRGHIDNDGGGLADTIETAAGLTVAQFFAQQLPGRRTEAYLIRVNRLPVSADHTLQEGDRVSITPTKIEGTHDVC